MDVASTAWHVISAGFTFLVGIILAVKSSRYFGVPQKRSVFLYLWHSLFCVAYLYYSLHNAADAGTYYRNSLTYEGGFGPGSPFIYLFSSVFSRWLGLSYLGVFLVFNVIGFYGLLATYGAFRGATTDGGRWVRRLAILLVLLPSASFWSSALGKDAFSFMAAGFALWSSLNLERRYPLMALAILAMLLVRPHMAALMVCSLAISLTIGVRVSFAQRFILGSCVLLVSAFAVPFAMNYAGLGDADTPQDIVDYMEQRQGYNMAGGGGVDISTMSPPEKLFTYLLRPLPHEAHSIPALAASLDNVVLALLFLLGGVKLWSGRRSDLPGNRVFLWIYVSAAWFVLAMTTANLGISVRQKWMFLPALMFLLLSYLGNAGSPSWHRKKARRPVRAVDRNSGI